MLKTKQVIDVPDEGFVSLLDCQVVLFCANYIYTGKLVGVNEDCVKLENPSIVYETGDFQNGYKWKDAQRLPVSGHYIIKSSIESFGIVK